jgi:acyl-[acyl-carrier-protein]-phospholipid O-acyltransferase/long-chain-fatty-acid--[acyl-carrier-protein] ligase
MPELTAPARLALGNALLAATTLAAILIGKGLGALADPHPSPALMEWTGSPVLVLGVSGGVLAVLGIVAAFRLPRLQPADPGRQVRMWDYPRQVHALFTVPGLLVPALSLAAFWGVAVAAELLLLPISTTAFGLDGLGLALLVVVLTSGIILGSLLAPWLMAAAYPAGVPLLGTLLAGLGLLAAGDAAHRALIDTASGPTMFGVWLFVAGFGAGLWDVPMQVLLQRRAPAEIRNRVMAAVGITTSLGMVASSVLVMALSSLGGLDAGRIYQLIGLAAVTVAVGGMVVFRVQLAAWLVAITVRLVWNLRVTGSEHIPASGGCVIACNHQSYADGLALMARSPRPSRFLIHAPFTRIPVLGFLVRAAGAIPVDPRDGHRALIKAIDTAVQAAKAGEVVLIFPEGKLSRGGQIDVFRGGAAAIAERAGVPLIPTHLDGLHGTWMARSAVKAPPRLRRTVRVRFGAPLPAGTTPAALRAAVLDLGFAAASAEAEADCATLGGAALTTLRRSWRRVVVRDQGGAMPGWQVAGAALAMIPHLKLAADERAVGVLLPPGRAGTVVNLALALAGRTAVNLNHTAGTAQLTRMCALAGVRTVVSSTLYRRRIGNPELPGRILAAEELFPALGKVGVILGALRALVLPGWMLDRARASDVAAIVFSSGSTGDPKGVQLTHRILRAQCRAIRRGLGLNPANDVILSPLPLFHSFGLVPGMWLGLAEGFAIAAHPDPTDGAAIGALAEAGKATFLISTPTFVRGWMRRIEPAQFASLRFAVVGAERCPAELKTQFKERYGADLLEGYGCTELAPVVSLNLPEMAVAGDSEREVRAKEGSVGRPLPGLSVIAVDPATRELLPVGSEGLLVVRSASRMLGYLTRDDLTAAAFAHGGYVTGDMGRIDAEGFVFITGRLARFAKIAGEMVPLDHVEAALATALAAQPGAAEIELAVATVSDPAKGERLVVLHTGWTGDWTALIEGLPDLPALWRPKARDVRQVDAIPKLGTGKRDLAGIKRLAGT